MQVSPIPGVNFGIIRLLTTLDTGGEVEDAISGRLLHDPFKGRRAGLFGCFSPQPTHQLNDSDGGRNRHMAQMGFAQADIPRASQAHRAHCLRVRPFNPCPMAIGVASTPLSAPAGVLQTTPASALLDARSYCAASFPYKQSGWDRLYNRVFENFTLMSDLPASCTGVQLELIRPCGQVTISACQSMENCVRS
jgi:hypothetical protein